MSGTTQPAQTGAQTIASGAAGVAPTTYGYYPAEGSRVISAIYTWPATQLGYYEDLSQLEARGIETTVQSAYVDNSGCAQPVTFLVMGSGQNITVGANRQQVIPLFFTGTPQLQITVAATDPGQTRVYYLNVPNVSSSSWAPTATVTTASTDYAQGSTTLAQLGPLVQAAATTAVPAYTTGTTNPLSMGLSGGLRIIPMGTGSTPLVATGINPAAATNTLLIGGAYTAAPAALATTNAGQLQVDSRGALKVINESDAQTYSAAAAFTPAATPTDVFTINGSVSKTVRVHQISVSFTATAATSNILLSLIKRSTTNTGGTSAAATMVPHDSSNAAGTAIINSWTANPGALGTTVGTVETIFASANTAGQTVVFNYGSALGDQSIVLRGSGEVLAVNLEGAALAGGELLRCKVKWTEI